MLRLLALLAALCLPVAAPAQDGRSLTGTVTYADRMALPDDALLIVEVTDAAGAMVAEARLPTAGRQVPIPFAVTPPADGAGRLRAGLAMGGAVVWLGDPVALTPDTPADLGELLLARHRPMGFAATWRCGDRRVMVGFAGGALVMDTGRDRLVLHPVPAAAGAQHVLPGDPGTRFLRRGEGALVSIGGTALPDCRLGLPLDDTTPYRAGGNEPFWSVTVAGDRMTLTRPGQDDLTLPVTGTALSGAGAIVVTAADGAAGATLTRAPLLCRDSMTGMPHPETVTLQPGPGLGDDDHDLAGCGGDPGALLTGQEWRVADIDGVAIAAGARVTLGFGADGRVAGAGGCNRWVAGWTLTGDGLSIGQAGATMMACAPALMDQDRRLFAALGRVTGLDIDATGALVLTGAAGQPVITARPASADRAP